MVFRTLVLCVLCALAPASGHADALTRASLAGLSGSERLHQFSMGQALLARPDNPALARAMRVSLRRGGYYHAGPGVALVSRGWQVEPVLAYDANINGGFLNGQFRIHGLTFDVDPTRRALSGMVGGARVLGHMRLSYGEGRHLDLRGTVEGAYSPQHRIGRARADVEACARNHLSGWNFADLCLTAGRSWRSLAVSSSSAVSMSFSRLHAARASEHEFSAGVSRRFNGTTSQTLLSMGWTAVWNRAVTSLDLTLGAPVAGQAALRERLHATVAWRWQDRAMRGGIWHQRANGGSLLGVDRADRITGVSLSVQARPNMTVELVHQVTRSSFGLFNENRTGLNVRINLARR